MAETSLEHYQEALFLNHWERASAIWSDTPEPLSTLMRIDYHQARNEPDLAWQLLGELAPRELSGESKAYFFLLRARSEYLLNEPELAKRNLKALGDFRPSGWTALSASRLEAALLKSEQQRARQELLEGLPEHSFAEVVGWQIVAEAARRDGRWSEASMAHTEVGRWARERREGRFLAEELSRQAEALDEYDPDHSLQLLKEALAVLKQAEGDLQPELLMLASLTGDQDLVRFASDELVRIRGELLQLSKPGRARWWLVGSHYQLPARLNRTEIMLKALQEAEESRDFLPAAWLSLALAERVFTRLEDRWAYIPRARENLRKLDGVYEGRNPFEGVSLEQLDASYAWLDHSKDEPSIPNSPQQMADFFVSRSGSFLELEKNAEALVSAAEREFESGERRHVVPRLGAVFGSLSNNARSWDPDLLRSAELKEPSPAHEVLRRELLARPAFVAKLLREMDTTVAPSQLDFHADLLLHLGRFEEARKLWSEIEERARVLGEDSLLLTALNRQLLCAVRTGAPLEETTLDRLETALSKERISENSFRLLSSIELLIVGGRLVSAREQLDRILIAAVGDQEALRVAAVNSLFIHRAMVGRLLGESAETTLALLERGREVSQDPKNWGWQVNLAYRAALLDELGRSDDFVEAYQPLLDKPFFQDTSRLQLQRRYREATGWSAARARRAQSQAIQSYLERFPRELRDIPVLARIEAEVAALGPRPPVTEVFLRSLVPWSPSPETPRKVRLTPAQFFRSVGELIGESGGEAGYLLPLQRERLTAIRESLPEGAVLYHPVLLPNRVVKMQITREELTIEEFYLNGERLRRQISHLRELCSTIDSSVSEIEALAADLGTVLWTPELREAKEVWLLMPRPLDGVPWPLISGPESFLRWTDGDRQPLRADFSSEKLLLAGAHSKLPGSKREIELLQQLFPKAELWRPETGFQGFRRLAREAGLIHLSGHGEGVRESGGGILDLGPLEMDLEALFSLELPNRPLVVLAACEGGSGYQTREGRSYSLVTPFRAVGASAVLAGIWALDDSRSVTFFERFYQHLKEGREPERVLHGMRRELVKQGEHPYYWSGLFLLRGLPATTK